MLSNRTRTYKVATIVRYCIGSTNSLSIRSSRKVFQMSWSSFLSLRSTAWDHRFNHIIREAAGFVAPNSLSRDTLIWFLVLERQSQLRHELWLWLSLSSQLILLLLLLLLGVIYRFIIVYVLYGLTTRGDQSSLCSWSIFAIEDLAWWSLIVSIGACQRVSFWGTTDGYKLLTCLIQKRLHFLIVLSVSWIYWGALIDLFNSWFYSAAVSIG